MIRFLIFILLFLLAASFHPSAQSSFVMTGQAIYGKVVDEGTSAPLPGVSIRIGGRTRGAVTNADGIFLLPEEELVTAEYLVISHIGYERDTVAVSALRHNLTIRLHPSSFQLMEVEITSKRKSQFPYQLLYDAIKRYRLMQDAEQCKAYFILQSESNGVPLEILEGYYNSKVSPGRGIENLTLVNGRIGISSLNDKNYLSLNTTQLLQCMTPFYDAPGNPFPESPGTVSFARFKRLYNVTIKKYLKLGKDRYFIVEFIPKKNRDFYFSGRVFINETHLSIDKMEYMITNCQVPVLHPIDPNDRIRSMQLAFSIFFDNSNSEQPRIDRISLGYGVDYVNSLTLQTAALESRADLFLYDYGDLFIPPLISHSVFINDYQSILTIPYEPSFWQQNEIMAPSVRQKEILSFFLNQGILMHYDNSPHEYLKADIKAWDPDTLLAFADLTGSPSQAGITLRSEFMHEKYDFQHDLYAIKGDVLIQPFMINDTVKINSKTLLHLSDSYYYANRNQSSNIFINLLFDIYEVYRMKILVSFLELQQAGNLSLESMNDIYTREMQSLDSISHVMKMEMHQGADEASLQKWNQFIIDHVGVDRRAQIMGMVKER